MKRPDENEDWEFLLSQYLDGQLSDRQAAELARRLEKDSRLREELTRYSRLNGELRVVDLEELDEIDYDDQRAGIMAAVERKALLEGLPRRRLVFRPVFRVLAAAAVLLMLASAGLLVFRHGGPAAAVPQVKVAVLGQITPAADSQLIVRLKRLVAPEPAPVRRPQAGAMPAGTVMVSIGGASLASAMPAGMFGIDGI